MADTVRYFVVVVDTRLPDGRTLKCDARSRHIERLSVMRRVLKRIRRRIQNAYGMEFRQR